MSGTPTCRRLNNVCVTTINSVCLSWRAGAIVQAICIPKLYHRGTCALPDLFFIHKIFKDARRKNSSTKYAYRQAGNIETKHNRWGIEHTCAPNSSQHRAMPSTAMSVTFSPSYVTHIFYPQDLVYTLWVFALTLFCRLRKFCYRVPVLKRVITPKKELAVC